MINITKSKLRIKILSYYFIHPEVDLHLRELSRQLQADPSNLLRELIRLEKEGIFVSLLRGRQRYFELNKKYLFFKELKSMISKIAGVESGLSSVLNKVKGVELCFIYGSYANGKERSGSDIDLLVVGLINSDTLFEKISKLEKEIGREINFRHFSPKDFRLAVKEKNSFILNITKNKKIFIIGDEKDIRKFN